MVMPRAPWVSLLRIIIPPVLLLLFSHVIISVDSCPLLQKGGHVPAPPHSQPWWCHRSKPPHCSPGSSDIVLLPVSSNSSGLPGPVRKAFLHTAPQVPANRSSGGRHHVRVCSQSQTPTTAHFLEGKYIQRAWMFLFLISLVEKKRSKATAFATMS